MLYQVITENDRSCGYPDVVADFRDVSLGEVVSIAKEYYYSDNVDGVYVLEADTGRSWRVNAAGEAYRTDVDRAIAESLGLLDAEPDAPEEADE